jgi:hypothetical protein
MIFSQIVSFQISLWHKWFFLDTRLPNLLEDCKYYLITFIKK